MNNRPTERSSTKVGGAFGRIPGYFRTVMGGVRWRRRKTSTALLIGAFVVGAAGLFIATASSAPLGRWSSFVLALSEALIVAGVLAITVDPLVQRKFAQEWGEGVFWTIFNDDAPDELRDGVNKIAELGHYAVRTEWYLTFTRSSDDPDADLNLECRSEVRIKCVDKYGTKEPPNFETGIVDRCDGAPSEFTVFEYKGGDDRSVVLNSKQIADCCVVDRVTKRTTIKPGKYLKRFAMKYQEEIVVTTVARTLVREMHSIPLFSSSTSLRWTLTAKGPAVADLDFHLWASREGGVKNPEARSDGDNEQVIYQSRKGVVSFPGHGLVLEWQPKAGKKGIETANSL